MYAVFPVYLPTNTITLRGRIVNPPDIYRRPEGAPSSQVSTASVQQAEAGSSGKWTYSSSHHALDAT